MSHSRSWSHIWNRPTILPWHEKEAFLGQVFRKFSSIAPIESPLLDVGCGRGSFIQYLEERDKIQCFGVDFASIRNPLRKKHGYIQADSRCLPIKSDYFSSITGILLIEHIPDYEKFLQEAARVLKPGGHVYLLFPNLFSLVSPALFIQRNIFKRTHIPYHKPLRLNTVKAKLESLKLEVIAEKFMAIGPFRTGIERIIGNFSKMFFPKQYREEIIIVARKFEREFGTVRGLSDEGQNA